MMVYKTTWRNVYQASSSGKKRPKKLDLTLSEWKTLQLDQSAEVSGWIHASHLVKCLKKKVKWNLKVCLFKQVVKYFIWNS